MTHTLAERPAPAPVATNVAAHPATDALGRLERARAVLERARSLIERGWLQHGWYVSRHQPPPSLVGRFRQAVRTPDVDEVERACLVAAVALAAHGGGDARPDVVRDAGPALDIVWDAMWAAAGQPGPGTARRVLPPATRASRMRELARWNDAAGRTRAEVLTLLDRAISSTILAAMEPVATR
jgi:hypothetical protein